MRGKHKMGVLGCTLGRRNSPGSSTSAVLREKLLRKRHFSSIRNDLQNNTIALYTIHITTHHYPCDGICTGETMNNDTQQNRVQETSLSKTSSRYRGAT